MASVSIAVSGRIGIVRIDNPPVNAISHEVRVGIAEGVTKLGGAAAIDAVVLLCDGRTFMAGADIREFGKPSAGPSLSEVCNAIEACPLPVIAALHGNVLGGGFEIALACHYRIARSEALLGLPEVNLGLLPGAGGVNRLARVAGVATALELGIGGDPITGRDALDRGIVDVLSEGELQVDALAFAERLLAEGSQPRPTRNLPLPVLAGDALNALAAPLIAKRKNESAPLACRDSLRRAMTLPFDEAVAADRAAFAGLTAGGQSRALRHAFFAERRAAKVATSERSGQIRSIAVIGGGTMGGGIAMSFAAAGIDAIVVDRQADALEQGMRRIRGNYASSVKRGSLSQDEADKRLARIEPVLDMARVGEADLVIEAVFEDMAIKQELFALLQAYCRVDAILATNTSALDVEAMSAGLAHPERFIGLHFFSPANVMKLVEVIPTATTDDRTLALAVSTVRKIGKIPVVAGNCDGFIGNRMVAKRSAEVDRLLLRGALPHEVDAALRAFGFPMGPLAVNDMSGLDIGYSVRQRRGTVFPIADAVVESGRLGQKTGKGYYRYEEGSRTPVPDPEIEVLIRQVSEQAGVERLVMTQEEMVERMLYPLINEGARILEEGIARCPSDIDAVWLNGYGFPRWRGGPMFHADEVGLPRIVERLRAFAAEGLDPSLEPAPLLITLADTGESFLDWDAKRASIAKQHGDSA